MMESNTSMPISTGLSKAYIVSKNGGGSLDVKKRKGGWTVEDDKVLADTVLTFVGEGRTQLQAFFERREEFS